MPSRLLVTALAAASALALAAPASAAEYSVSVTDFEFQSSDLQVAPGDTVAWNFVDGGHTTTSSDGQAESWDSNPSRDTSGAGATFRHTFTRPGLYDYICRPHQTFMSGSVTVGQDEFERSQSSFKQVRRGRKIMFRFTLVEPAQVVARLRGEASRKARRPRLEPGPHSIAFKRLPKGRYRGIVTFTDDFQKRSVVRTRTTIR